MASIPVHMTVTIWCASVTEEYHYLVETFRIETPEIPHHGRTLEVGVRITFLSVDKVGEFLSILDKEYRSIVSNKVPVAFISIELNGKASWVTFGVCTSLFSTNS